MSGPVWTKQARATVTKEHVTLSTKRILILALVWLGGTATIVAFLRWNPPLAAFVSSKLLVHLSVSACIGSTITLYLRYIAGRDPRKLYLPLFFGLTFLSMIGAFMWMNSIVQDEVALMSLQARGAFGLHATFSLLLAYVIYKDARHVEQTKYQAVWFGVIATLFYAGAIWLVLSTDIGLKVQRGIIARPEEFFPIACALGAIAFLIKNGTWKTSQMTFTLFLMSMLNLLGSIALLLAGPGYSALQLTGYLMLLAIGAAPFVAIFARMLDSYLHAEQYRTREGLAKAGGALSGGQELSPAIFKEITTQLNEAIAITDMTGRILFTNKHLRDMTGFDEKRLMNNSPVLWQHQTVPQDFYANVFAKIRSSKTMYEGTVKNSYPNDRSKGYDASIRITPVLNEFGEIACCVLQQRSLSNDQEQLVMLRQMLDTMPLGVMLFENPSLNVKLQNQQAELLLSRAGYDFRTIKNFSDLVTKFKKPDGSVYPIDELPLKLTAKTAKRSEVSDIAIFLGNEKAPNMIWKMTAVPFFHADGSMRAVLIDFDDVSKHLEFEHKMTDFVSVASHQLRTPLTSIKWSLDALRKQSNMPEADKLALFDTCYQASERMMDTIHQLLKVAELERDDLKVQTEAVEFGKILDQTIATMKASADEKKITFKQSTLSTIPTMHFNPLFLTQVVENLIENAIRYTPENGVIDSILTLKGDQIEWTLHDNGIGIPKQDLDRVFEKFFRADNAQRIFPNGTGLGLYIVKKTLDHAGGSIRIESEEGHGTTMIVSLPLVQKV